MALSLTNVHMLHVTRWTGTCAYYFLPVNKFANVSNFNSLRLFHLTTYQRRHIQELSCQSRKEVFTEKVLWSAKSSAHRTTIDLLSSGSRPIGFKNDSVNLEFYENGFIPYVLLSSTSPKILPKTVSLFQFDLAEIYNIVQQNNYLCRICLPLEFDSLTPEFKTYINSLTFNNPSSSDRCEVNVKVFDCYEPYFAILNSNDHERFMALLQDIQIRFPVTVQEVNDHLYTDKIIIPQKMSKDKWIEKMSIGALKGKYHASSCSIRSLYNHIPQCIQISSSDWNSYVNSMQRIKTYVGKVFSEETKNKRYFEQVVPLTSLDLNYDLVLEELQLENLKKLSLLCGNNIKLKLTENRKKKLAALVLSAERSRDLDTAVEKIKSHLKKLSDHLVHLTKTYKFAERIYIPSYKIPAAKELCGSHSHILFLTNKRSENSRTGDPDSNIFVVIKEHQTNPYLLVCADTEKDCVIAKASIRKKIYESIQWKSNDDQKWTDFIYFTEDPEIFKYVVSRVRNLFKQKEWLLIPKRLCFLLIADTLDELLMMRQKLKAEINLVREKASKFHFREVIHLDSEILGDSDVEKVVKKFIGKQGANIKKLNTKHMKCFYSGGVDEKSPHIIIVAKTKEKLNELHALVNVQLELIKMVKPSHVLKLTAEIPLYTERVKNLYVFLSNFLGYKGQRVEELRTNCGKDVLIRVRYRNIPPCIVVESADFQSLEKTCKAVNDRIDHIVEKEMQNFKFFETITFPDDWSRLELSRHLLGTKGSNIKKFRNNISYVSWEKNPNGEETGVRVSANTPENLEFVVKLVKKSLQNIMIHAEEMEN